MASAGTAYVDVEARTDTVADAIQSVLDSVNGTVEVTADVSDAEAAIAAVSDDQLSLFVDADMSAAESELNKLEASPVEVPVDADTVPAQGEIDSLDGGEPVVKEVKADTEEAQKSIDDLSGSIGTMGEAAQGALGGLGGLSGATGGAVGALGATAVAGGAAAAGLVAFSQAAIDAESASQRFQYVAGGMADELSSIDVGGLSGDIGELALKIGSSDEAMLNATSSFVTFAESTGASSSQIVEASDNINALALRAAALNPELGDAGAVAERLATALARGGRATAGFGIGLTSAEINARALADTGKESADELTQFEKAAAGAAIATERLGNSMGEDFSAGAENARNEWNRMTESFGEAQETVGARALPAIENITEAVTNLSEGLTNLDPGQWLEGLWGLGPGLIANGFTDLWGTISGGEEQIRGIGTLVNDELPAGLRSTASAADEAAAEMQDLAGAMSDYLAEVVDIPASQRDVQQSITDLSATMQDSESSWFDMADAQDEVITSTAQTISKMQEQGRSQGELDATIYATIGMLASERNAGRITEQQFQTLSTEIRRVPHKARTDVETPGLPAAISGAHNYRAELDRIPRDITTNMRLNTGRLYADIAGAAASLRSLRDIESASGGGRRQASTPVTMLAAAPSGALVPVTSGVGSTGSAGESAGASIVVNVHGTATAQDGQAVVDALRRWQQRNGPVPVRVNG